MRKRATYTAVAALVASLAFGGIAWAHHSAGHSGGHIYTSRGIVCVPYGTRRKVVTSNKSLTNDI